MHLRSSGTRHLTDDRSENEQRNHDKHIGDAHQEGFNPATEVSSESPNERPDKSGYETNNQRNHDGDLGTAHG